MKNRIEELRIENEQLIEEKEWLKQELKNIKKENNRLEAEIESINERLKPRRAHDTN